MQNRGARNVISFEQYRPFARSRAILQFAARATWPQNARRKNHEIAGGNAPLARPRRATVEALLTHRAAQNHPSSGGKTRNPSRKQPPPLVKMAQNPQNRVSLVTRRNSPMLRRVLSTVGARASVGRVSQSPGKGDEHRAGSRNVANRSQRQAMTANCRGRQRQLGRSSQDSSCCVCKIRLLQLGPSKKSLNTRRLLFGKQDGQSVTRFRQKSPKTGRGAQALRPVFLFAAREHKAHKARNNRGFRGNARMARRCHLAAIPR